MRTKQAIKNAVMSLLLQVVLALSGFIIPRYFISLYGSPVNGLVSSINQFITYMGLVEAGIGAAATVALYAPLAGKRTEEINGIVSAARKFYCRSGIIFLGLVLILTLIYPFIVQKEIPNAAFVRMMILILSVNGLIDYFYLGKYRVLLMADQRGYIISLFQIVGAIVMTAVCFGLMALNSPALLVKGVAAVVYLLRSLAVGLYVKKNYPSVSFRAAPCFEAFGQRWAALLHQIVGVVVNNTDVVLLTLLLSQGAMVEVSVYSVYRLVESSLYSLMNSISNGLSSGFGEVISKKETGVLNRSFSNYEFVFFPLIFIVFSCMAVLCHPFVALYSVSFPDREVYIRWALVALFTISGLLQSLRLPGLTMICAAGHYRQTRSRAVWEAVINLVVSVALIYPLGIVGVLIGTCASYLYRTTDVIFYTARHLVPGCLKRTGRRILRNAVVSAGLIGLGLWQIPAYASGWGSWLGAAVIFGFLACVCIVGVNWLCEPREFRVLLDRVRELKKRERS